MSKGKAVVDFVIESGGLSATPVEMKSSTNVQSKGLGVSRDKYAPETSIRISTKNFGREGGIRSIPLYAAFCI